MLEYRSVPSRPRAIEPQHIDDAYWSSGAQSITVHQSDSPRDTGLLDVRGNPIMAFETIGPIGFKKE